MCSSDLWIKPHRLIRFSHHALLSVRLTLLFLFSPPAVQESAPAEAGDAGKDTQSGGSGESGSAAEAPGSSSETGDAGDSGDPSDPGEGDSGMAVAVEGEGETEAEGSQAGGSGGGSGPGGGGGEGGGGGGSSSSSSGQKQSCWRVGLKVAWDIHTPGLALPLQSGDCYYMMGNANTCKHVCLTHCTLCTHIQHTPAHSTQSRATTCNLWLSHTHACSTSILHTVHSHTVYLHTNTLSFI